MVRHGRMRVALRRRMHTSSTASAPLHGLRTASYSNCSTRESSVEQASGSGVLASLFMEQLVLEQVGRSGWSDLRGAQLLTPQAVPSRADHRAQ